MRRRRRRRKNWRLLLLLLLILVVAAEARLLFSEDYLGTPDLSAITGIFRGQPADWRLILVNADHAVPKGYEVELTHLSNGVDVDSRIYPDLQRMFDDARAQGVNPTVVEGYRSHEAQIAMMQSYVDRYAAQGYTQSEAREMALAYVAEPGTSEHELGIAVDVGPAGSSTADQVYGWLAEHAWDYGFILRYPADGEEITGIAYEPWHYRYVGPEAAQEIRARGVTLEEYLKKR